MMINSYRFLDPLTRKVIKSWVRRAEARKDDHDIPWTPLAKPLSECTVAIVSSAAIRRRDDRPFDQEGERRNPWWGDPSFRVIPKGITEADIRVDHLHVDSRPIEEELDVALPLRRLEELAAEGVIGTVAKEHYSLMGYILKPEELLATSAPAIAEGLRSHEVDVALLVPV